jgi:hypothetical protein
VLLGSFKDWSILLHHQVFHRRQEGGVATNQSDMVEKELENWTNVYGQDKQLPQCFVWRCASTSGSCLILPYLKPIPLSQRSSLLNNGSISQALSWFSNSGYIHLEPNWRILVLGVLGAETDKIYFCDLGLIKKEEDKKRIVHVLQAQ